MYKILSLPIVEGENVIVTIEKADMMLTQDKNESFHSDLIKLQDEHKTLLDLVKSGQKLDGMIQDPLEEYQNKIRLEQEKYKQEQEEAKKDLLRKENEAKHEEEKTAFGFMGNQEDQQKLVEEVRANMRKKSEEKQAEQNLQEPVDIEAKPESNS